MNDVIQPESFSTYWFMYELGGLFLHSFIFAVCGLGMTAYAALKNEMPKLRKRLIRFGAFLIILLPIGGLFNAFWCCLVYGNLYVQEIGNDGSVLDVDSPENDFTPFWPPSHHWLAGLPGHLTTVSMPQLQLVWLFFAATAWAISFILYRLIRRKIVPAIIALSRTPLAVKPSHA
jgi:hypothetical protein